jgi:hypothetical protein
VQYYFNEYKIDAVKHSFNPYYINTLCCIEVVDTIYGECFIWGQLLVNERKILLDKNLLSDTVSLQKVLYHELGHWYGLSDIDTTRNLAILRYRIMNKYYDTSYKLIIHKNWNYLLDEYFTELKVHNPEWIF